MLSEKEYDERMAELGLIEEKNYEMYFLGDMAFLGNVDDDVNQIADLIKSDGNGHYSYSSETLMKFSMDGGKLAIGPGAIDDYGVKHKKGLYCTNYKELFSPKNKEDRKM